MKLEELIKLYKGMRTALIITVPLATWGFMYWLSTGDMLVACLFGIGTIIPTIDIIPSAAEVRRRLRTRQTSDHIWYLIESRDTGEIRMCK